ncbi:cache domain-containing protein [Paenibacillus sp. GSMTC-2017]|uniref:methyl-accepting chemotaxis protein n=1 Tax=Paenibacillus sp. GSMTC-2017 TaxID=2794350 RepID=UPI0018D844F1|nr:methyl-accepting chemotaxis protein [Paenibacillus sp. GSMTC-2017]MBH5318347.1 cache domain-containing protein [Paenibacillus sp. GSMTC-2017]
MLKVTRKSFHLTIRKKLLIMSLTLLTLPILVLGAVAYQISIKETDALIESKLSSSVNLAIELIENMESSVKSGLLSEEEAQEQVRTLLLGAKNTDGTRPINKAIDLGPNGYFFIIDKQGKLLAHPVLEGENIWDKQTSDGTYYIQNLIAEGLDGGGATYYNWPLPKTDGMVSNGGAEALKISYAKQANSWGWIIAAGSYMKDYNAGQKNIMEGIVTTLILCLVVGIAVLLLFSHHISKPIVRIAREAEKMANGDLSGDELIIRNHDEIGQLGRSFNLLAANIRQLVGNLTLSSNILASSSKQLSLTLGETNDALHQTSSSIADVANNNEIQANSAQETSRSIEEMVIGIQKVAEASSHAYQVSLQTLQEADHGNSLINHSSEQMNAVSDTVNEISGSITRLNDHSDQIGTIVETIKGISDQTNLLALNAAIEAARSGEHGRGFAVVANEVRKLAGLTSQAAEQVSEMIEEIRSNISNAHHSMNKGQEEVAAGVQSIEQTGIAFEKILESTRTIVNQVQESSSAAHQMSASTEQMSASVIEVEQLSLRSAASAQTVSASVEEQLASVEEIAASARKLRDMSDEMRLIVSRFNL